MKSKTIKSIICGLLLLTAISPIVSAGKLQPVQDLYSMNIVNLDSKSTINPVGKIVKYAEGKNVKPIIMERTKSHARTLSAEDFINREEKIKDYMTSIASGVKPRFNEEFFEFLEDNELVYYELGESDEAKKASNISPMSTTSSDVSLTTPFMVYDAVNKRYEIWGGFHFSNDNAWWQEARNWFGYANPTGNIGKADTVGINLDGGTNGAALVSFSMQPIYADAPGNFDGGNSGTYSAPAVTNRVGNLSSDSGAMFLYQDKCVSFGLGSDGYAKYANNFGAGAVRLVYSSAFAQASGNASTYYAHTWDNAEVTGVTLNSDGSFSISITNSNKSTGTLIGFDYAY